jgi:hypothetical protein
MKRVLIASTSIAFIVCLFSLESCVVSGLTPQQVADSAKELRGLLPGIQAGLMLAKPDSPTSRALTPGTVSGWPYGADTPGQVYTARGGTTGTVRVPAADYYSIGNDKIYFTLTPDTTLGPSGYFRLILYTYPAFDMSVAYTVEEYLVNSAATWPWNNLNAGGQANSWISLQTAYLDGTTGQRTVVWNSNKVPGQYYAAFSVTDPNPSVPASFSGYHYDDPAPATYAGPMSFSSETSEAINAKNTVVDSDQYYTETSTTVHSGLTKVFKDKKRKWSVDTYIVTRMTEDTTAESKTIRSVGEVGATQYYIDKVDIWKDTGIIKYSSSHDVYYSAVPRGGDPNAGDFETYDVTEDAAGAGTFTGTMEETRGNTKITRDVTIKRDNHYRFQIELKYRSTGSRALPDTVQIPLTRQDLQNLSIPLPLISGNFTGYYEDGSLYGTISATGLSFDVVVTDEGVGVNDQLYPY